MNILIIHPEGNINSNPNLYGIAEVLVQNGYNVDVLSSYNENIYQQNLSVFKLILLKNFDFLYRIFETERNNILIKLLKRFLTFFIKKIIYPYSFIIGVDRDGVILANLFSQITNVPYSLISYEIFFEDETSKEFKKREIDACQNIKFAICQDPLRSEKLSNENKIDIKKIINVPVAGKYKTHFSKNNFLRKKYNIDDDVKIALFLGAISERTCIDFLLQDLTNWPEDWVLVLHSRYENDPFINKIRNEYKTDKLIISAEPYCEFDDLYNLPLSSDIGITLNQPTYKNKYTGKNIKYLGWSSGKLSIYLQCGLPVIINSEWDIANEVVKNRIGYIVDKGINVSDILKKIKGKDLEDSKIRCINFFENKLALNNYEKRIITLIKTYTLSKKNKPQYISFSYLDYVLKLGKLIQSQLLHLYKR